MENYAMTNFEEMVADEMFPETNNAYDSENFPTKDRSRSSARRKKTYFKGKKRFNMIHLKGFTPLPEQESVLRGMTRKTSIIRSDIVGRGSYFETSRSNIRRQETSDAKLTEFAMEG